MNTVIPLGVKEAKDVGSVADVIAMLADAAGGDAKIIISRHEAGKIAYCETVQLATIEAEGLDYVQRKYGGGEYRMQLHAKEDGGNRAAIRRGYDVKIANIPTPPAPAPAAWQQTPAPAAWDGDKIIAVLTAAAPLVRTAAEWWSARQPQVMTPYNNPVQGGGGLAALSETLMSLQIMGQLKETVGDVFGSVASSDGGDKRGALLQALTPALGMLMQPTQAPTPTPTPTPEHQHHQEQEEEDMAERSQYETVLALIAESIRSGNQDTVIALLEECEPTVSAQILSASGMQIAMFAGRFALSVAAVRASLENAKEVLNAPNNV